MPEVRREFGFSIDRGGTFTDVYAEIPGSKKFRLLKLLSEDPANYSDAPREGIRRILEEETGIAHPRNEALDTSRISYIRMGTTVATNALLERKGERCALVTTKGFRDLLLIGNQSRRFIFDLVISRPELLYEEVVEVNERVILVKNGEGDCLEDVMSKNKRQEVGVTGELVQVVQSPDLENLRTQLRGVLSRGITSLAVVFLHSYTFSKHEIEVGKIAIELGFSHVSLSSEVMPMVKVVGRGYTTAADAYLTPIIKKYLASFRAGFDNGFGNVKTLFMQSDGGLTPMQKFRGSRAILSGPAGGVVGYASTAYKLCSKKKNPNPQPVIGLDMGGTSSDVSRYAGSYEHVFETVTAGITLQSPQLDINTVAAGGGSRLFFRGGLFTVGPESAGAHPGPICYRKGGYLAVTDANVYLGRIVPKYFPCIFGPEENQPLDAGGAAKAFKSLAEDIGKGSKSALMSPEEVALGFLRVAIEAMCRPIRNLTTMKGYDITNHILASFGGAGPQFCCAIAQSLGISLIKVHRLSGVLSAYGISVADVVSEKQEPCAVRLSADSYSDLSGRLKKLEAAAKEELLNQGFLLKQISCKQYLNLRFSGTDTSLMICSDKIQGFLDEFLTEYQREFGFLLEGRHVLVDDARVRAVGSHDPVQISKNVKSVAHNPIPMDFAQVYWEGLKWYETPIYLLESLQTGQKIEGPSILIQDVSTVVIEPCCTAEITDEGDVEITVGTINGMDKKISLSVEGPPDPVYLSVFAHRFMGIAEQMGKTLQRTSISVNIKERLDFSCALFDASGGLVANAPHLPVHLGAMQDAVKYQMQHWGPNGIKPGDVLVSNHPQLAGGSHLPDITVITPVFVAGTDILPSFFVASRGHHADVGGIAPGSMPPLSKSLSEEGAAIIAYKLVERGEFMEEGISLLLKESRNLADNLSDLRAQVAANTRGTTLMQDLANEYGLSVIQAYMGHIQNNAEKAVRSMLVSFSRKHKLDIIGTVQAEDFMDDGTRIALSVTIDRHCGSATFDFSGTDPEVFGNLNAPPAVTTSAVIYTLRCMVPDVDIPLNQGCLKPIRIIIPEGSLLSPSSNAAVVGGNVLTSQRVTDVILRAFQVCAASQGCMNNLTLGDATMGYYETIAGGAGAGPYWHGCSGVHTHMTNTRITDPEILERRYPLLLKRFELRKNSGGRGKFNGGDGVCREIMFRKDLVVSILSERRAFQPYGLMGGEPGSRGKNLLKYRSGKVISLGGKNTIHVQEGDALTILSPGGGGYGTPELETSTKSSLEIKHPSGKVSLGETVASENRCAGSIHQYQLKQEQA